MGRLTLSNLIEAAVFFLIVGIFYAFSFEFNQPIEIYIFGATAWPRVVIFLLLLSTLGNLWFHHRHGNATQATLGQTDDQADFREAGTVRRMVAVLLTPFVFAYLLKPVGIYVSAPFFIAAIIWLFGERRWKAILIMTLFIYCVFIGLFLMILNAPLPQGNVSPFYDFSAWVLKLNAKLQGI